MYTAIPVTTRRIAPLITALGVSVFLQNAVLLLLGPDIRNYDASSFIPFTSGIHAGPLNVSLIRIIVIVATVAVMLLLTLWVGRSKLGREMRAVAYDREGAQMIGVDVDRTIMIAFFVISFPLTRLAAYLERRLDVGRADSRVTAPPA